METVADPKVKILAGLPTYEGMRWNGSAMGSLYMSNIDTFEISTSLLTSAFNRCWVEALNKREDTPVGVTHFLLMHADIVPVDFDWVQQLWAEFAANKCKVLSVAVPIKNDIGLTSIGVESDDPWRPRRLTMTEIMDMPVTWTAPNVLVNTGMLLVDFTEPWVEKICFTIRDKIHKPNGKWVTEIESEDWNFSRQCRELGVDLWVTRKVAVQHMGRSQWRNDTKWGQPIDPGIIPP